MRRLTHQDWETITGALALLEAHVDDDTFWEPGETEDAFAARINDTWAKVAERTRSR